MTTNFSDSSDYVHHPTRLVLHRDQMRHNLDVYRGCLAAHTKVMVMVKAFAYGLDAVLVSQMLASAEVDYLGVAYLDEGRMLREAGIQLPILVMNPFEKELRLADDFGLEIALYSFPLLDRYLEANIQAPIHLKLDTGMNRLGFRPEIITQLRERLAADRVSVKGIFTHLSSSDEPVHDAFTQRQLKLFDIGYEALAAALAHRPMRHVLNSPGIVRFPENQYEMVRLGIGLYGHDPAQFLALKPAASLLSSVSQVHKVRKGESIGYGRKGRAVEKMEVAVVPVGYADGYRRAFGQGKAKMRIKDQLLPTVGNICMDMCMLDVTGLKVKAGDQVMVFGDSPTIQDLALLADTIPYEIIASLGNRIKRMVD